MKKYIYTILLVWLAMVNVQAQENNEIQEPKPDEKVVVGAIGGTVDLTALGGASYTIPVKVPEGIGGIQPNLSIVYNSQSGNGLLGWGWNLGGLSAITRVGHTLYHDGYVDGVDFDGDRFPLMASGCLPWMPLHMGATERSTGPKPMEWTRLCHTQKR